MRKRTEATTPNGHKAIVYDPKWPQPNYMVFDASNRPPGHGAAAPTKEQALAELDEAIAKGYTDGK